MKHKISNAAIVKTGPEVLRGPSFYIQIALFCVTRTVINTGFRMVYPFLPTIARDLRVSESAVTLGITVRSALGLLVPLFGSVADGIGRKRSMLMGLGVFVFSMLLVFVCPTYPVLIVSLILTTVTKFLFDPAMYAYLGDRVAYQQRGLAVGLVELGWSGAFLLGIPIAGFIILNASAAPPLPFFSHLSLSNSLLVNIFSGRTGWNAPYLFFALIAIGTFMILWKVIPDDRIQNIARRLTLVEGFRNVLAHPPAVAGLVIGVLISASNEVINVIFGVWIEDSFAIQLGAIGLVSAAIGIAELGGEGLVAAFVDRLGIRRSLVIGLIGYTITCLLLPILGVGFGVQGAVLGLFLFYLGFEFTIVASLPLMTELMPQARSTFMALNGAGHALGRMIGSLIGPVLFRSGLGTNATVSVVLNVIALGLLLRFISEYRSDKA